MQIGAVCSAPLRSYGDRFFCARSLLAVQIGAICSACDARCTAPFSAPDGTTVGTSEMLRSSVPVAFKTVGSAAGTSAEGIGGKLLTEAVKSYSPTCWV